MSVVIPCGEYAIQRVYQQLEQPARCEIIVFWLENGALTDFKEAKRRVAEVVLTARNREGEVVGVTSVYPAPLGKEGPVYLHYRMFIRRQDRGVALAKTLVQQTQRLFHTHRELRGAAPGMIICMENPKLMQPGVQRQFSRAAWSYAGKDPRGCDVWKFDFDEHEATNGLAPGLALTNA